MTRHLIGWGLILLTVWWSVAVRAEAEPGATVPVLCYHRFGNYGDQDAYSVSQAEFAAQLEILRQEGMTPVTVKQLAAAFRGEGTLPAKPVVITIDDGYRDFLTQAKPLLEQYGYTATLFVYSDFVGARLGLKPGELADLEAAGFEIGSHSASHPRLNRKKGGESDAAYLQRLKAELEGSRVKLEQWSQGPIAGLAYPYGLWNETVARAALEAGYELLFTVNPGVNTSVTDRRCLKRTMILRGTKASTFRTLLNGREMAVTEWQPPLGAVVRAPVDGITLVVDAGLRERLAPGSIQVRSGSSEIPHQYDAVSGRLSVHFAKPWTRGTDLIVLTARDRDGMLQYKQSRLLQIQSVPQE